MDAGIFEHALLQGATVGGRETDALAPARSSSALLDSDSDGSQSSDEQGLNTSIQSHASLVKSQESESASEKKQQQPRVNHPSARIAGGLGCIFGPWTV